MKTDQSPLRTRWLNRTANRLLDGQYLRAFNRKFARQAPARWTRIVPCPGT